MTSRLRLPARLLALTAVGSMTVLAACSSTPEEAAAPPPPPETSVANVQTFDLGTADPVQVGDALLNDGRVIIRGITFDTDSAELTGSGYASVTRLGAVMEAFPELTLAVVGHTDDTGAFDYNLDLSQRRAESIVSALQTDFDIAGERLAAVGVGELSPVASNDTDFGRSQNRRVELVLIDT